MDAKQHMELMRPELVHHLRNTVTVGTGPVTELRKAAADEIERLRALVDLYEKGGKSMADVESDILKEPPHEAK
jgi:hypothetical protein